MTAAAFKAEYADWKLIRTRKVVQIVLEVPVETAGEAYKVLSGMPITGQSVWCAVARLQEGGEASGRTSDQPVAGREVSTSHVAPPAPAAAQPGRANKSPAQVAGYLCTLPPFWKFLNERDHSILVEHEEDVAAVVRFLCGVEHRSEILPGTDAERRWNALRSDFRVWEMAVV